MRIIAGDWRGRRISAPRGGDTRPTSDRVREAIFSAVFSALGALDGRAVLDLYAGSGALGLEALSRGAGFCTFVESSSAAAAVIRANAAALGAGPSSYQVLCTSVARLGERRDPTPPAALLLADPPYRIDAAEFSQVLEVLGGRGLLERGALVVYEHAASVDAQWPAGFDEGNARRYGDSALSFATYEG